MAVIAVIKTKPNVQLETARFPRITAKESRNRIYRDEAVRYFHLTRAETQIINRDCEVVKPQSTTAMEIAHNKKIFFDNTLCVSVHT